MTGTWTHKKSFLKISQSKTFNVNRIPYFEVIVERSKVTGGILNQLICKTTLKLELCNRPVVSNGECWSSCDIWLDYYKKSWEVFY